MGSGQTPNPIVNLLVDSSAHLLDPVSSKKDEG
jgi:hypothetical protein